MFWRLRPTILASYSNSAVVLATLAFHVLHVIGVCSEKQVFRIDAHRSIAFVKDKQSLRDFSLED